MGRSVAYTYRLDVVANVHLDTFGWEVKTHGKPTAENAERYRRTMNAAFQPGGCNFHISEQMGVVPHISKVTITRQRDGKVMAEPNAPAFEVV